MTEEQTIVKLLDIDETGTWYVKTTETSNDKNLPYIASFHTPDTTGRENGQIPYWKAFARFCFRFL